MSAGVAMRPYTELLWKIELSFLDWKKQKGMSRRRKGLASSGQ